MTINAIHMTFKETEKLRLNFIALKKLYSLKIEELLYYVYE